MYDILRRRQPRLKAVFMSGYTDSVVENHGPIDAPLYFIAKPFLPSELIAQVNEALAVNGESGTPRAVSA